jgi:hemerythrin-like metal-binding protein
MKDIVWDQVLSIGVDEIDEDHRRLVDLFNILNHSVTEGDSAAYVSAVLEELINCTIWHFSHEERLMLKYDYDGLAEHKAEHRDLITGARELQQKYMQTGELDEEEDLHYLERWLTEHIFTTDMRLGTYLVEEM